ncbi:hypothetical protein PPERSA_02463 [Pseudocohnilembus persalinus]|uniref:Uncharacterized protein n=1 Tax=Pseudocohnilembus persalinus TaxID=266149 RepID=A0A0V0QB97_PSEPJ|nr:hypothetical protein PPERSA_02463 [Pseudocohnilembus persalinus]|eukprot:KRW99351.1 hypothetical protein PPERSA_02463 [Pseudocohnilembus persalinus]
MDLRKYVQEHIENFEFQELNKFKSGNFMVQFCAGEIISRAFIVKGGLNYVSRQQLDGYRLQIFDDLGNLCNEKGKTCIYYNERIRNRMQFYVMMEIQST